ncbi:hypothetical protein RchiOBHm_Chr5g0033441 [Rosa chinensis]|uniref:Uncharacterized protein n=1 Tax=Rosa chinensis TaxID=74649 RepID=A0A2P6QAS1_ROSCH|nr:hypothetical protein RchiOBHm_Chr5g0033441 [Rosa chinensis]
MTGLTAILRLFSCTMSSSTSGTTKKDHAWRWTKPIPGELKYFLVILLIYYRFGDFVESYGFSTCLL